MKKIIIFAAIFVALFGVSTTALAQTDFPDSLGKALVTYDAVTFDIYSTCHTLHVVKTDRGSVVLDCDLVAFYEDLDAEEAVAAFDESQIGIGNTILIPKWWGEIENTSYFVAVRGNRYLFAVLLTTTKGFGILDPNGRMFFPHNDETPKDINAFYYENGLLTPGYLKYENKTFTWFDINGVQVLTKSEYDDYNLTKLAKMWNRKN